MLTIKDLKEMKPKTIFARGYSFDNADGINMMGSGVRLKWVAVRGGIWDWAVYCGRENESYEQIRDYGDKVHDINTVKRLVECDDEALRMYRH